MLDLLKGFLILFLVNNIRSQNIEDILIRDLMKNYSTLIRPSIDHKNATNIFFDASIVQITSVDEKYQMVSINAWLTMTWTDHKLSWDPRKYEGAQEIRLPSERVWKPVSNNQIYLILIY